MVSAAAPLFYDDILRWLLLVRYYGTLILLAWAFIHCVTQRPDKFVALGGLQKQYWLLILGVLFLFCLLGLYLTMFLYIGLGAAAYYLLETRRGLKDVSEGHW